MAALLVALSVMAVLMTAVMPVWHHMAQREREEEWVFRGRQYARAILLFQRKAGPGVLPPTVDILVEQHFLRKKYTDPITGKDFDLVYSSQAAGQAPGQTAGQTRPGSQTPGAQTATGSSSGISSAFTAPAFTSPAFSSATTPGGRGGIMGVVSSSKAESIRVIDGRSHYNEIPFLFSAISAAPGAANTANPGSNGNTPGGAGRGNSNGRGTNQGNAPMGSTPPPGGGFSAPTFSTPPFGSGNQSPQSLPPRYPNGQPVRP